MQEYPKLVTALMELRRKAQLEGRTPSQEEVEAISAGYFQDASQRAAQSKQVSLGFDQLALEKWQQQKMMDAANSASRNALLSNLINTGGTMWYKKDKLGY